MSDEAQGSAPQTGATVLTTTEVAERHRTNPQTITAAWRAGKFPPPLNPWQTRNYRWSLAAIEAYERGEQIGGAA